jgi:hypothetical protein
MSPVQSMQSVAINGNRAINGNQWHRAIVQSVEINVFPVPYAGVPPPHPLDARAARALAIVASVVVPRVGSGNNSALTAFGLAPLAAMAASCICP